MRLKLTNAAVEKKCPGPTNGDRQALYWDTEQPGFGLVVGQKARTFVLQKALKGGRVRRIKIGRLPAWSVDAARQRAMELTVQIDKGLDPVVETRRQHDRSVTLAEAMEAHIGIMLARGCVPTTAEDMRYRLKQHLGGWLSRPLSELTRFECRARHRQLTTDSGPHIANGIFRYLRAIYNSALKAHDIPPLNPCIGVGWNKLDRRREPIPWESLPAWHQTALGLPPVQRDYQLFVLFTGLRSTDAATVRWEHVDLAAGTIHRPNPKGGKDKAFTVPLAAAVVEILKRRQTENQVLYGHVGGDHGWVFPCFGIKANGIVPLVWRRLGRTKGHGRSPHRLRDTFATAAHGAGLDWFTIKVLLNHAPPSGDVTAGYIRPSVDDLRPAVEKVSAFLKARL